VFSDKDFDESEYSDRVSSLFKTDHTALRVGEDQLLDALPHAVSAMDQPTVDGINTYLISRSARELGLKVALSGLGGDELFGGYDSFRTAPRLSRLDRLFNTLPPAYRSLFGKALSGILPRSDRNTKLAHLIAGRKSGCHVYFLLRALFCEEDLQELFADKEIANEEALKNYRFTQSLLQPVAQRGLLDQISYLELTHYMSNTLLRDTDVMSMAHSLEVRVPLIDHRLVELMFSIPEEKKFKGDTPKPLLTASIRHKLPDQLIFRKKMGFTLPFEAWLRKDLRKEMESVLLSPLPALSGIISESAVTGVWQNFLDRRVSWSRPWALYILKRWAEKNLGT
jgi:asparagine synthase (glutamine-hydrolysing)